MRFLCKDYYVYDLYLFTNFAGSPFEGKLIFMELANYSSSTSARNPFVISFTSEVLAEISSVLAAIAVT